MKKFLIAMTILFTISNLTSYSATWEAKNRVEAVGKEIISKNNLPAKTNFKVVEGIVDNSNTSSTNIIQISSENLKFAGNDSEVAAIIANEIGHIVNGKTSKDNLRNIAKAAISKNLNSENVINTTLNSEFVANKINLKDEKIADVTGVDLLIKTNYNPLAAIVVLTKQTGSTLEILQGKPANSERAMYIYDYITYNYPTKIKNGYGCQEYKAFLEYANPIVQERNSNKKKLAKFNKEQEKNKKLRAKELAKYRATGGLSGWEATYDILNSLKN